jgi:hypothetical protein
MYDYPYRVEYAPRGNEDRYQVVRTGEGVICEGSNVAEMRKLADAANEMLAMEASGR